MQILVQSVYVLVIVCSLAAGAFAQSRSTAADLAGVVTDQSQAVLPGVTITATHLATNQSRAVVTDARGRFIVPALQPGEYRISAELSGFTPEVRENVRLALGTAVDVIFSLRIAGATEEVTVLADSPLVDTQQTAVATVVNQQQIDTLPINGRNFISFSIITPAVSTDRTPQQGASATSGLTFAGQRARSNNITVDGLDNNDSTLGAVRATFSQEAVQEFQVLTNSYSAEFGKASGGVVNIVTRSGSNRFSGNGFFYLRDETLNAKEHFERVTPAGQAIDREKADFGQKQFGFTMGGPVKRDRMFFFTAYEQLDINANNFVNIDDSTPLALFGRPIGTAVDVLRRAGFLVETGNVPYQVNTKSFLAKLDGQLSQGQNVVFRFTWGDGLNENVEPWGGQVAKSRGALLDSEDFMYAGSHTAVLSSRLVNEARAQVARRNQDVLSLDPICDGLCDTESEGGPTLEIGAIAVGRQRFTPQPRSNTRVQVIDTLSYYTGRHHVKSGLDFSYVDSYRSALPLHFGGRYIFRPFDAATAAALGLPGAISAIQAVELGIPAAYVQGYGNSAAEYTASDLSLFVQDDWRVRDDLTVKVGLRYQNQYWPSQTRTVPGLEPYAYPTDGNNLAPRVAASWNPGGDRRTSVHGSYGIFYDNHISSIFGITDGISGADDAVRTLAAQLPSQVPLAAWRAPGRKLPLAAAPAGFPSLVISIDPGLKTPYAQHASFGIDRDFRGDYALSANFIYARGKEQVGTVDYNPVVPSLGAGRRPLDVGGRAGTSSSVLQYTSFGETWYRGLTVSLSKRYSRRHQFLMAYTLSKAEDTSADFQSFFIPQENGLGRNPSDPNGLPVGFDARAEKGPSLQDQRHRFVLSGLFLAPGDIQLSTIVTLASGRPYNILAGVDLNGDGNGGATAPDRPRTNPADASTSIGRNAGVLPAQYTVDLRAQRRFRLGGAARFDAIVEVFNLFNRTNYTDVDNIFGTGAYPSGGLATFGQFTQAGPPLQAQLAARISF